MWKSGWYLSTSSCNLLLRAQWTPAFLLDRWKVTLLHKPPWAWAKTRPKVPQEVIQHWFQIPLFSPLQNKKAKISLPKGERKVKTKTRIKEAIKTRAQAKVRTTKVDLTSLPPFRLVLGRSSTSFSPFLKALHPACHHLGRSGRVYRLSSPF